jgi:hypothetical protein
MCELLNVMACSKRYLDGTLCLSFFLKKNHLFHFEVKI